MAGEQLIEQALLLLHSPIGFGWGKVAGENCAFYPPPGLRKLDYGEGRWKEIGEALLSGWGWGGNQCRVLGMRGSGEPAGVKPCLGMTS